MIVYNYIRLVDNGNKVFVWGDRTNERLCEGRAKKHATKRHYESQMNRNRIKHDWRKIIVQIVLLLYNRICLGAIE